MRLSEYYKDSKYSENGKNYEVVEAGKNQRSYFKLKCVNCLTVCTVTAASVLSGRIPCSCGPKTKRADILPKFLTSCGLKGIDVISVPEELSAKQKLPVKCNKCTYCWDTTYNSIVLKDSGCPLCNGAVKIPKEVMENRLLSYLNMIGMKLEHFQYTSKGYTSKCSVEISCEKCGNVYSTSVASVLNGCGCPKCAKFGFKSDEPATTYLISVEDAQGVLLGYKYGITCNLEQRMTQHRKLSTSAGLNFKLIKVWHYTVGQQCSEHERVLKCTFPPHITKNVMPAGFTETISVEDLDALLNIQNNQHRRLYHG